MLVKSSIGRKAVVAVTGVLLFGFVVGHMLGNLQIFIGPEAINAYAHKLKSMPGLLWPARIGLLVVVTLHIYYAIKLNMENRQARPVAYGYEQTVQATYGSLHMVMTGMMILLFIIYHLLQFTFLALPPGDVGMTTLADGHEAYDVYKMVVLGFSNKGISAVYIVAQILLAIHLSHGMTSIFQTVGLFSPRRPNRFIYVGPACGLIIAIGNISIPLAVLFRFVALSG